MRDVSDLDFLNARSNIKQRQLGRKCAESASCKIFTYKRDTKLCYTYASATFKPNEMFDTGMRPSAD